ncbi:MAG: orotidine-5'-phosphate decarboxylase [Candidatus Kapabacteria bacterium]|jgi:orotidine-5'-phosphate decarboxylase|nr:orotidine-5'-phosphate decarboxylase [Candidatus Kapabacteria bacterium]
MIPNSGLCIGLDIDPEKIPLDLRFSPTAMEDYARLVVEATRDIATCFKINVAFFERYGKRGIDALYAVREAVGTSYVILDAKRGDIGNTSSAYADAAFGELQADAVTVAPYMGRDSVEPFLDVEGRMVYILALTSNPGSADFQRLDVGGKPLYRHVMDTALSWHRRSTLGFVVGATHPSELATLREAYAEAPFLIPGIGTQGASAAETAQANGTGPAVFNVSRAVLYGHTGPDLTAELRAKAMAFALDLRE